LDWTFGAFRSIWAVATSRMLGLSTIPPLLPPLATRAWLKPALLNPLAGLHNIVQLPSLVLDTAFEPNHHVPTGLPDSRDGLFLQPRTQSLQSKSYYAASVKRMIQIVATVSSSLSLILTLITFYWFRKMKKRLRHKCVS
jgi:hypothetical protein